MTVIEKPRPIEEVDPELGRLLHHFCQHASEYKKKFPTLLPITTIPGYQEDQQIIRDKPKVGRNDPCPCGSGKKYKKCCLTI